MSYILDALRRAESERDRERGVPGLNAQPVPAGSLLGPPSRRARVGVWIALGLGVGLAVPMAWRWLATDEAPASDMRATVSGHVATPPSAVTQGPGSLPANPADVPPPSATPEPAIVAAAASATKPAESGPAVRPPAQPAATDAGPGSPPAPQAAARPPRAAASATPAATRPVAAAASAATPAARPVAAARPAPPAERKPARGDGATAPAATAATALPRMSDLPEDLRRQLPTLAFGGSVHSPMPAQRMVIFNGQVLREGDTVAEGLTVEEIRAKSAVLRIRGQRFEIVF